MTQHLYLRISVFRFPLTSMVYEAILYHAKLEVVSDGHHQMRGLFGFSLPDASPD